MIDNFHPKILMSLGAVCAVAHQLNRVSDDYKPGIFDWLVTPFSSIISILKDKGSGLCESIFVEYQGQAAVCRNYGVMYWHEFPRGEDQKIIITAATLHSCREKLIHKLHKFNQYCHSDYQVLFVRFGGYYNKSVATSYHQDSHPLKSSDINRLVYNLEKIYPMLDFRLIVTGYAELTPFFNDAILCRRARVKMMPLPEPSAIPGQWMGVDTDWDRVLSVWGNLAPVDQSRPLATTDLLH